MVQFLGGAVWPEISRAAKRAKRRAAAVAYIGRKASKLLPLKRGDVLIANVTLEAVKYGQTDPSEILKLIKRGVEVHSVANLHAKVVLGGTAVIGSANVFRNSADYLSEGVVLTTQPQAVSAVRGYINSLRSKPLTEKLAEKLIRQYRAPEWSGGGSKATPDIPSHDRLWVLRTEPVELSPDEEKISNRYEKTLTSRLRSKKYEVNTLRWHGIRGFARSADTGQRLIQVYRDGDSLRIYPPVEILGKKRLPSGRKTLIFLCEPVCPRLLTPKSFEKALKRVSVYTPVAKLRGEIRNPEVRHKLLGLWSSVHR